jgi:hypothetical protein
MSNIGENKQNLGRSVLTFRHFFASWPIMADRSSFNWFVRQIIKADLYEIVNNE